MFVMTKQALKTGSNETFVISSKDYSSFAIIINGEWNFFAKNSKTGNFELNFTVPSDIQILKVSGGTTKSATHWGLVQYNVVQ
jgi:HKD family nuclease